jgi:hypothetical protein
LNAADGLARGYLGCSGTLIDKRYPGIHTTGIDPRPAEVPNRVSLPFGVAKNFSLGEHAGVNDGVEEDSIAFSHLGWLAIGGGSGAKGEIIERVLR